MERSFKHLGGKIEVSNSSAAEHGGAVLRSFSGVFGTIWDGCRLSEINSGV